jgi:hypothetical protein
MFFIKKEKLCSKTHHYRSLFNPLTKACGQFVVSLYEGNVYLGKIINFKAENIYISFTMGSLKSLKWPEEPDILEYGRSDVLVGTKLPKLVSELGFYLIPELSTFLTLGLSVSGLYCFYNIL